MLLIPVLHLRERGDVGGFSNSPQLTWLVFLTGSQVISTVRQVWERAALPQERYALL